MRNSLPIKGAKSLTVGSNNIRVMDLTLLRSSRLSLTGLGTSLLLEGLHEPSVKYKYSIASINMDFVSDDSIEIIRIGSVRLVCYSMRFWHGSFGE